LLGQGVVARRAGCFNASADDAAFVEDAFELRGEARAVDAVIRYRALAIRARSSNREAARSCRVVPRCAARHRRGGVRAAAGLWAESAAAVCVLPRPRLVFSHPSAETQSLAPDAVIWALGSNGPVEVAIDGVALESVGGGSLLGDYQFVPDAPLAPGAHELTIQLDVSDYLLLEPADGVETIVFEVVESGGPVFDVDSLRAEITAVTSYPLEGGQRGDLVYPRSEFADDCSAESVDLTHACYDFPAQALVRIDLRQDPRALAYLVGDYLVPATCKAFFPDEASFGRDPAYGVSALSPSGIGPEREFTGAVEVRDPTAAGAPFPRARSRATRAGGAGRGWGCSPCVAARAGSLGGPKRPAHSRGVL
jgi:hypothetical protein